MKQLLIIGVLVFCTYANAINLSNMNAQYPVHVPAGQNGEDVTIGDAMARTHIMITHHGIDIVVAPNGKVAVTTNNEETTIYVNSNTTVNFHLVSKDKNENAAIVPIMRAIPTEEILQGCKKSGFNPGKKPDEIKVFSTDAEVKSPWVRSNQGEMSVKGMTYMYCK